MRLRETSTPSKAGRPLSGPCYPRTSAAVIDHPQPPPTPPPPRCAFDPKFAFPSLGLHLLLPADRGHRRGTRQSGSATRALAALRSGSMHSSPHVRLQQQQPQTSQKRRQCNCKRSGCLKLYCECFASGVYCDSDYCNCSTCFNNRVRYFYVHYRSILLTGSAFVAAGKRGSAKGGDRINA
jgi:hypothetical protein